MPARTDIPSTPQSRVGAPADFDAETVGSVGRFAMAGALAGSLGFGALVTLGGVAASAEIGQALGVGAAVALTGGPFFGALIGFGLAVHAAEVEASRPLDEPLPDPALTASL